MKRLLLCSALAVALVSARSAEATGVHVDECSFESRYSLQLDDQALRLTRESGTPQEVRFEQGQLWIDGELVALSNADRQRIDEIEQRVRALLPEVRDVAMEGAAMAGAALTQVAVALGGADSEQLGKRIAELQAEVAERFDANLRDGSWEQHPIDDQVEAIVEQLVPELVGNITSAAVSAALSGDEKAMQDIERRAQNLEHTLEREMEARGKVLEARAEALCPRVRDIDALENALELRLRDGSRLDLVQM